MGLLNRLGEGQYGNMRGLSRNKFQDSKDAIAYYETLVELYTARKMTYQGDAVVALEGVLAVLRATMSTQFIFGIPESYFNEALLWESRKPLRRRRDVSNNELFPTWTWAGWENNSNYRGGLSGYIRPEVDWFLITKAGDIARLVPIGISKPFDGSGHKDVRHIASLPDRLARSLKICSQLKPDELESSSPACWSSIASFQFMGDTVDMGEDYMLNSPDHERFVISNTNSVPVGSIDMEKKWSNRIEDQTYFEFMLLSRSNNVEGMIELDETNFPMKSWCFLNVMLVMRQENIVERLEIGVIHENAWVTANPIFTLLHIS